MLLMGLQCQSDLLCEFNFQEFYSGTWRKFEVCQLCIFNKKCKSYHLSFSESTEVFFNQKQLKQK